MPSHLSGLLPPFRLPSNIVYFHDWRYVSHGAYRWENAAGDGLGLFTNEDNADLRYRDVNIPHGVRLVAQRPCKGAPVIAPDDDEMILFGGSLIHEEGRYRLWVDCWPGEQIGEPDMGNRNFVRTFESADGETWTAPRLGLVERNGTSQNNIVYGGALSTGTGYHGGCVFRDPVAPASERYKMLHLGKTRGEAMQRYLARHPDDVDPMAMRGELAWALFGAVSPDGCRWKPMADPLLIQNSDTHNTCSYDVFRHTYVGYIRTWVVGRRTIGRVESKDFGHFRRPEQIFWPGPATAPDSVWYANGKTAMPDAPDYHLMFPMRWSLVDDKFDFFLASSPDNVIWNRLPGGPVCEPGERGGWDCGVVVPGFGMVWLPGDRMGILYCGTPLPHKYPRRTPLGRLAWAWWPKGRLVGLEAPGEGDLSFYPLTFSGQVVHLNYRSGVAGFIQVEAIGPDNQVLPGRGFEDCDFISGNEIDRVVTWRGQSHLGHPDGAPVRLHFRMRTAELFSVRFGKQ